ncbi:putative T7SS-secreted protein [Streptomyces cyaneofuscatus]
MRDGGGLAAFRGWADKLEDWGDAIAWSLGAEVGERQLGQSEEADELIHGKPEKITAAVKNLRDFQKAFGLVGGGLKKLDSGNWRGEAADTFRSKFQALPTRRSRSTEQETRCPATAGSDSTALHGNILSFEG